MRNLMLVNRRFILVAAALFAVVVPAVSQRAAAQTPMGTAFTYEGQLLQGGNPVNDTCNFEFSLWDDGDPALPENQVGGTLSEMVAVEDGRLTALLDFGADIFMGEARFMEIAVCCPSPCENFTTLAPRQELTPAPHALALPGLYTQQNVTSPNLIGGYSGNFVEPGAAGATISGGGLSGNENRALDNGGSIGGGTNNQAGSDDGIPNNASNATVGGGQANTASGSRSTVGGGFGNIASGNRATVPGGQTNTAAGVDSFAAGRNSRANHAGAFVWSDNTTTEENPFASTGNNQFLINATGGVGIGTNAPSETLDVVGNIQATGTLSSGSSITIDGTLGSEKITSSADLELHVSSGRVLRIEADATSPNLIGGYSGNSVEPGALGATIGGGGSNQFRNHVYDSHGTVAGGRGNTAGSDDGDPASAQFGTVAGGSANEADGPFTTVGGGYGNAASGNSATVGGGYESTAGGWYATVPGGALNLAAGDCSFAAGRRAKANHYGTFVWGDLTNEDFSSTGPNQFLIRASGGVGIGTNAPLAALHIGDTGNTGWDAIRFPDHTQQATAATDTLRDLSCGDGQIAKFWFDGWECDADEVGGGAGTLDEAYDGGGAGAGRTITADAGAVQILGTDGLEVAGTIQSGSSITIDGTPGSEKITSAGDLELHLSTGRALRLEVSSFFPDYVNVIAGFRDNTVTPGTWAATIAGGGSTGRENRVYDSSGTVGGGEDNRAGNDDADPFTAMYATVAGGYRNTASGQYATMGGGSNNEASGDSATVGGGANNEASESKATVAGGSGNTASGVGATVGGGSNNTASGGTSATVPGGASNTAGGYYSFAAGYRAKVRDPEASGDGDGDEGTFVWADSTSADFTSTGPDQFLIRATGGVGIGTNDPNAPLHVVAGLSGNGFILPGLRTELDATSPNLIGGYSGNTIDSSAYGVTIGGGGTAGLPNYVYDHYGTVAGGQNNAAGSDDGDPTNGHYATIGGGRSNSASGFYATIAGGASSAASGNWATIGGGNGNTADGPTATVGGGSANEASGELATVSGGSGNIASGTRTTIAGGYLNIADALYATVSGGESNLASGVRGSVVGGGEQNIASRAHSTVPGGYQNQAGGDYSFSAGHRAKVRDPVASGDNDGDEGTFVWADATVADFTSTGPNQFLIRASGGVGIGKNDPSEQLDVEGNVRASGTIQSGSSITIDGTTDTISATSGTISFDDENLVTSGTIEIGGSITIDGAVETITSNGNLELHVSSGRALRIVPPFDLIYGPNLIGGYSGNTVDPSAYAVTIGGGGNQFYPNIAYDNYGTIGGGLDNQAGSDDADPFTADFATVGGGFGNAADGATATVGGGIGNYATGHWATVGGGGGNYAPGDGATIGGGGGNWAKGWYSTVPGGLENQAGGDGSFAGGWSAHVRDSTESGDADGDQGTFIWADYRSTNLVSTGPDQFLVRAQGGMWFGTDSSPSIPAGRFLNTSTGGYLTTGGTWTNGSDRDAKENFADVSPREVLEKVAGLPVSTWNYKTEDPAVRHMGPMAQDLYAAFGLGDSDKSIATIDADGVALAAIQGLHEIVKEKDAEIQVLQARLARLEAVVSELATKSSSTHEDEGGAQ